MNSFNLYRHSCFKMLTNQLEKCKHSNDPEIIHEIRISLKKIKSLFNLIEYNFPTFNAINEYKTFKKIFKKTGFMRDFEITNQILNQYKRKIFNKNEGANNHREKKNNLVFRNKISQYKKTIKKYNTIAMFYCDKMRIKSLKEYLNIKDQELKNILLKKIKEKKLHSVRKMIKEINYLSSIQKKYFTNKNYDLIQKMIGDWHDKKIAIKYLKNNISNKLIKALEKRCKNDLKLIHSLISKQITKLPFS